MRTTLWTSEEAEARDREDVPKAVHLEAEPGLGSGSEAGALSSCFRAFVSFSSVGRKTSSRQTGGARVRVTGDPEERGEWPGPRVRLPPHPNPWLGGNCPLPSPALAGGREQGVGGSPLLHIRVMVAMWNEFGSVSSSEIFWEIFRRIGVNSPLSV